MKRRAFFGLLGGLVAVPFLAKKTSPLSQLPTEPGLLLPPGYLINWYGKKAPPGFLLCNGQIVSRSTYSELFAAIGHTYSEPKPDYSHSLVDSGHSHFVVQTPPYHGVSDPGHRHVIPLDQGREFQLPDLEHLAIKV